MKARLIVLFLILLVNNGNAQPAQNLSGDFESIKKWVDAAANFTSGNTNYYSVPDFKNDTAFYYYDNTKTMVFCKGKLARYRKKCRRISFEAKQFINSKKEAHQIACTKVFKRGTWFFYDVDGTLMLECNFKKVHKFSFRRKKTVAHGSWKYFDKTGKLILTEQYKKGRQLP